jgi:hypothetical protein
MTDDKKPEEKKKEKIDIEAMAARARFVKAVGDAQNLFRNVSTSPAKGNGKGKNRDDNEQTPEVYTAYKYSNNIPLAEQIQLDNQNQFLQIIDGEPRLSSEIEIKEKNIVITT